MHRPDLLNLHDEDLVESSAQAWAELSTGVACLTTQQLGDPPLDKTSHTAWALVHGLAGLTSEGAFRSTAMDALSRKAACQLFTCAPRRDVQSGR